MTQGDASKETSSNVCPRLWYVLSYSGVNPQTLAQDHACTHTWTRTHVGPVHPMPARSLGSGGILTRWLQQAAQPRNPRGTNTLVAPPQANKPISRAGKLLRQQHQQQQRPFACICAHTHWHKATHTCTQTSAHTTQTRHMTHITHTQTHNARLVTHTHTHTHTHKTAPFTHRAAGAASAGAATASSCGAAARRLAIDHGAQAAQVGHHLLQLVAQAGGTVALQLQRRPGGGDGRVEACRATHTNTHTCMRHARAQAVARCVGGRCWGWALASLMALLDMRLFSLVACRRLSNRRRQRVTFELSAGEDTGSDGRQRGMATRDRPVLRGGQLLHNRGTRGS